MARECRNGNRIGRIIIRPHALFEKISPGRGNPHFTKSSIVGLYEKYLFAGLFPPDDGFAIDARKLFDKRPDLRVVVQPVLEVAYDICGIRAVRSVGNSVVDPQPLFVEGYQAGFFQDFQMLACRGLGNAQCFLQLADAERSSLQQLHDSDPGGVRQGLHDLYELFHLTFPITGLLTVPLDGASFGL